MRAARGKAWQSELRAKIEKLVAELEAAPANTRESAQRYADRVGDLGCAHQVGGLEQTCIGVAGQLRVALSIYLPAKKAPKT